MESVRIDDRGQITLPIFLMEKMGLTKGDEIFFYEENGRFVIQNTEPDALTRLQDLMEGEAERVGWKNTDDIASYMKKRRYERNKPV